MSLNTFLLKYILGRGGDSQSPLELRRNASSGHTPLPDAYCQVQWGGLGDAHQFFHFF